MLRELDSIIGYRGNGSAIYRVFHEIVGATPVEPSFVIFDIRVLWRSGLKLQMRQKLQMTA